MDDRTELKNLIPSLDDVFRHVFPAPQANRLFTIMPKSGCVLLQINSNSMIATLHPLADKNGSDEAGVYCITDENMKTIEQEWPGSTHLGILVYTDTDEPPSMCQFGYNSSASSVVWFHS